MWITSLLLNLQVAKIPLCSALADGSEILHQFEYPTNCCISKFHLGIRYISHLLGILRIPYPTKKLFLSKECSWICENISIVPVLGRLFYINIHPGSTLELITLELMGSPNEISFPTTKNGYALNKDPTMIAGYNNNAKQDESLKIKDTNHNSWWLALKRKITFIYIKYIFYIYIYILLEAQKCNTSTLMDSPWNLWTSGDVGEAVPGSKRNDFLSSNKIGFHVCFSRAPPKFNVDLPFRGVPLSGYIC